MEYILQFSKEFDKRFRKLDNSIKSEALKKIKRLKENPKEIGKNLKYLPNFYELHVQVYRIFYVVVDNLVKVLLLDIEHKDECDKYLRSLTPEKIKQSILDNS